MIRPSLAGRLVGVAAVVAASSDDDDDGFYW